MAIGYHGHALRLRPLSAVGGLASTRRRSTTLELGRGEHPLLREADSDAGAGYVATERGLYSRAGGESEWHRIAWIDIAAVDHSQHTRTLTLHPWPAAGSTPIQLHVQDRSRLPAFALERVTSCQILTRRVDVTHDCTIAITALREGDSDTVRWLVQLPSGRALDDPALAAAIDRAVQQLRTLAGC